MKKYKLNFRSERCKACLLCVNACPVKILELDKDNVTLKGYNPIRCIDINKCIGCKSCAIICPDSVIEIEVNTNEDAI